MSELKCKKPVATLLEVVVTRHDIPGETNRRIQEVGGERQCFVKWERLLRRYQNNSHLNKTKLLTI